MILHKLFNIKLKFEVTVQNRIYNKINLEMLSIYLLLLLKI